MIDLGWKLSSGTKILSKDIDLQIKMISDNLSSGELLALKSDNLLVREYCKAIGELTALKKVKDFLTVEENKDD